jgi:hypothetical protein
MNKLPAYIGIAAALGMAVCDMILLALPVSGTEFDLSSFGAMEQVGSFRADIGSTLGLVCAFFICFGFWHLKKLFEPVNPKLAMLLFIALCSVEFFGGAFHAGYYFLAGTAFSTTPMPLVPVTTLNDFRNHLETLSYLGVPGFLIGSILFFKLGLDKRFPAWFRFANPLITCGFFLVAFIFLPAPVGGYLKPTFINLGLAGMFMLALTVRTSE